MTRRGQLGTRVGNILPSRADGAVLVDGLYWGGLNTLVAKLAEDWSYLGSNSGETAVLPARGTSAFPISCATCRLRMSTRSGALTSPMCRCCVASCTWLQSSTGTAAMCSPGSYPTPWTASSVSMPCARHSARVGPRSSTPTRAHSSRPMLSPPACS